MEALNEPSKWTKLPWVRIGGAIGTAIYVTDGLRRWGLGNADSVARTLGHGLAGLLIGLILGFVVGTIVKTFISKRK